MHANVIWLYFIALLIVHKCESGSLSLWITWASSANLRKTTPNKAWQEILKPCLMSSVCKHFGFCKKGYVLDKSLAVCRKYKRNTTNLSTHLQKWWYYFATFCFENENTSSRLNRSLYNTLLNIALPCILGTDAAGPEVVRYYFQFKCVCICH